MTKEAFGQPQSTQEETAPRIVQDYMDSIRPVYRDLAGDGFNFGLGIRLNRHNIAGYKKGLAHSGSNISFEVEVALIDYDIPNAIQYGDKLIRLSSSESISSPTFTQDAVMTKGSERIGLHILDQEDPGIKKLTLVQEFRLKPEREILLSQIPPNFEEIALKYDFTKNPNAQDQMRQLAEKRIPADIVPSDLTYRSAIIGLKDISGYRVNHRLYLQNPNPSDHLRCYEVEVFDNRVKNIPETLELSPESIWQDSENHYCLADSDTFPFIPFDLSKAASFTMRIRAKEALNSQVRSLIGDIPLSIDGSNEWYAVCKIDNNASISILHTPSWRRDGVKLVYKKNLKGDLTSHAILDGVKSLKQVRSHLKEELS